MFRQCLFGLVVPRDSVQIRGVALYVLLDFDIVNSVLFTELTEKII